jgi:hypothetical protein
MSSRKWSLFSTQLVTSYSYNICSLISKSLKWRFIKSFAIPTSFFHNEDEYMLSNIWVLYFFRCRTVIYISLSLHLILCLFIHIYPTPPFAFYVNRGKWLISEWHWKQKLNSYLLDNIITFSALSYNLNRLQSNNRLIIVRKFPEHLFYNTYFSIFKRVKFTRI